MAKTSHKGSSPFGSLPSPSQVAELITNDGARWNEELMRDMFELEDDEFVLRVLLCTSMQ